MDYASELRRGMTVFSSKGEKLGQITDKGPDLFLIEKGLFFPKDYGCAYDKIASIRGDEVYLSISGETLKAGKAGLEAAAPPARPEERAAGVAQETRIPLAEEHLEASRRGYEAGEVRIRKDVEFKTEEVSVPLRHEEVTVERVPVEAREAKPGEASFEKSTTTTVPVYEEELEIRKRPVIREEVRVAKQSFEEERHASEEVRKETAKIEKSGDIEEEPTRK